MIIYFLTKTNPSKFYDHNFESKCRIIKTQKFHRFLKHLFYPVIEKVFRSFSGVLLIDYY
jgi:hypothetical protein